MVAGKTIAGIILIGIGVVFLTNNKALGEGAAKLYQKIYTEKNMTIMFRMTGALLVVGGLVIGFLT